MVRLFVTGDNHIGRKFDTYSDVKEELVESRFQCLEAMVERAESERCEFFVVTGDLFDNTYAIAGREVKRVVEILGGFAQNVLVLPGNHDFYSGNEKLWTDFLQEAASYSNIILLNEYRPYPIETSDGPVAFYPAFCDCKKSETNRLEWMKGMEIDPKAAYHIGLAHGALDGLAPDKEGNYFLMNTPELRSIPMDLWLLGHAHVTFPREMPEETEEDYGNIFNAGTHEQLDLHNRTEGNAFVITLQNREGRKKVLARRIVTGRIRYYDESLAFTATDERSLEQAVEDLVKNYPDPKHSVVRLKISGSIDAAEYRNKESVYAAFGKLFLHFEVEDHDLSERITREKIESEFSEIGFAARFLEELLDEPTELQMAYELIESLK